MTPWRSRDLRRADSVFGATPRSPCSKSWKRSGPLRNRSRAMGVYHVTSGDIPTIQYGILLPILIGAVLIWRSETAKRVIAAVPQPWLVGVQLYRALGAIFLILYPTSKLPAFFAWPAGMGDVAVGLLAPVVGLAY